MTKEKPILFNTEMVRAVLAGNKTQTRRVIKSPAKNMQESGNEVINRNPDNDPWYKERIWSMRMKGGMWGDYTHKRFLEFCPYGKVGDRLWVRETFYEKGYWSRQDYESGDRDYSWVKESLFGYAANGEIDKTSCWKDGKQIIRKKPSIHMPRKYSRINLEITDIRVERVQDITEEAAKAEGAQQMAIRKGEYCHKFDLSGNSYGSFKTGFNYLWDSINKKRDNGIYSWDKSPWVWVVEFKLIKGAL